MKDTSSPTSSSVGRLTSREKELENKRALGQASCAECRRLKLKCDKKLPCSSCVRRGCSTICPNGYLSAGSGTRFVLANTDRLHAKLLMMSQRIRQLEDALQIAQASLAPTTHPLLSEELLQIKSGVDLLSTKDSENFGKVGPSARHGGDDHLTEDEESDGIQDLPASFGVMSIAENGDATFLGRAASESLMMLSDRPQPRTLQREGLACPPSPGTANAEALGLPPHLVRMSKAVPFTSSSFSYDSYMPPHAYSAFHSFTTDSGQAQPMPNPTHSRAETLDLIESYLPSYAKATSLVESFLSNIAWFQCFVDREQIYEELLPMVYDIRSGVPRRQQNLGFSAPSPDSSASTPSNYTSSSTGSGSREYAQEREAYKLQLGHDAASSLYTSRLALLFIVLSAGHAGDFTIPLTSSFKLTERYKMLAVCSLALNSVFVGTSMETVQALMMFAGHDFSSCRKDSLEPAWKIVSLALGLASSIGLHRDPAQWGPNAMPPKLVQRRRRLFWEIFTIDKWKSLEAGRPATFNLREIDCQMPEDCEATLSADGETVVPSFWTWKYRLAKEVTAPIAEKLCMTRSIRYSEILELDRRIRDFNADPLLPRSILNFKNAGYMNPDSQGGPSQESAEERTRMLRRYSWCILSEVALLYVHRIFFARAMLENPMKPLNTPYASSALSAYASAVTLLKIIRTFFEQYPDTAMRLWIVWAHALTSAVIVGAVACRGPVTYVAATALKEFEAAVDFFQKAQEHPVARRGLPLLLRLLDRSRAAQSTTLAQDVAGAKEELAVLCGAAMYLHRKRPELHSGAGIQSGPQSPELDLDSGAKADFSQKSINETNTTHVQSLSSTFGVTHTQNMLHTGDRLSELPQNESIREQTATDMAWSMFAKPGDDHDPILTSNKKKYEERGRTNRRQTSLGVIDDQLSTFGPSPLKAPVTSNETQVSTGHDPSVSMMSSEKGAIHGMSDTSSFGPQDPFNSTSWLQELSMNVSGRLGQSTSGSGRTNCIWEGTSGTGPSFEQVLNDGAFASGFAGPMFDQLERHAKSNVETDYGRANDFDQLESLPYSFSSPGSLDFYAMSDFPSSTNPPSHSENHSLNTTPFPIFGLGPGSAPASNASNPVTKNGVNGFSGESAMNIDTVDVGSAPGGAPLAADAWRSLLGDPQLLVNEFLGIEASYTEQQ